MRIWKILLLLIGLLALIAGIWVMRNPEFFPIKKIEVYASYQHLDQALLRQDISLFTTNVSFFSFPARTLARKLLEIPWINRVSVRRIWPGKIIIQVIEQTPVAIWSQHALLNEKGEIFKPEMNTIPPDLPLLSGPDDQAAQIWQYYKWMLLQAEKYLQMQILKLDIFPGIGWQFTLNNGVIVVLGDSDVNNRFMLFLRAYPKIIATNPNAITQIDMRYNNGFSVKWKG